MLFVFLTRASFAEDADTVADLQCLVAIMETGPQIDKVAPGSSQVAAMYFLGRIDGRSSALDLEAAIRRVTASMSQIDIGAADVQCGKQLSVRGHTMQAIGEHLILNPKGKR
jgi:hypothetical protein